MVSEGVASDASTSIGVDEGLVEIGFFVSGEGRDDLTVWSDLVATKHKAKEAVQGYEVGTEGVIGIFTINDFRKVKRIDADVGIQRETNITTTDSVAEALVFVFWVDDKNLGADHHRTESFKFNSERFTGTGFGEDDEVGVF